MLISAAGRGLVHVVDEQPTRRKRVHVDEHRPVDELERHARRNLVDDGVLAEVLADPPVALVEDLVVDPAAPRCLEQRVADEEQQAAAGSEHPRDLPHRAGEVADVLEREACEHGVDTAIRHRQLLGTRTRVPRPAAALRRPCDLRTAGVEADHVDAGGGELPRHLAFAAPDVEHPTRAAQVLHHERDDLLLVLDVGAVGVLPLPPRRARVPASPRRPVLHERILVRTGMMPR